MLSLSSIAVIIGSLTAWTAIVAYIHYRNWEPENQEEQEQ